MYGDSFSVIFEMRRKKNSDRLCRDGVSGVIKLGQRWHKHKMRERRGWVRWARQRKGEDRHAAEGE